MTTQTNPVQARTGPTPLEDVAYVGRHVLPIVRELEAVEASKAA